MTFVYLILFVLNFVFGINNIYDDYPILAGLNFAAVVCCGYRLIEALGAVV